MRIAWVCAEPREADRNSAANRFTGSVLRLRAYEENGMFLIAKLVARDVSTLNKELSGAMQRSDFPSDQVPFVFVELKLVVNLEWIQCPNPRHNRFSLMNGIS